jgi:uncharacterized protein YlxW (UPF0749 family)
MSQTKRYYEKQSEKNTLQQRIQKLENKLKQLELYIIQLLK